MLPTVSRVVKGIPLVEIRIVKGAGGLRALREDPVIAMSVPGPEVGVVPTNRNSDEQSIQMNNIIHMIHSIDTYPAGLNATNFMEPTIGIMFMAACNISKQDPGFTGCEGLFICLSLR